MWDSNPNCGIARERKKKRGKRERENFPMKSSNLRHYQPLTETKDWVNTRGELASCGQAHPPPEAGRQAGHSQSQKARGNLGPRDQSSTKLWAGFQLLTESCCDPGWLTSARRATSIDKLPRGDTRHTWDSTPAAHLGNWAVGTREVIRCTAPPWESACAKRLVTQAAHTWERHKMQAQLSLCLCGVPKNLNLSGLDLELHTTQGPP